MQTSTTPKGRGVSGDRKKRLERYVDRIFEMLDIKVGRMSRAGSGWVKGVPPQWFRPGADGHSFTVMPGEGFWHDHNEDCGGDIFDLVARRFGLDTRTQFREVLEKAEGMVGIIEGEPLPEPPPERPKNTIREDPYVKGAWSSYTYEEVEQKIEAAKRQMRPDRWKYLKEGYGIQNRHNCVGYAHYPWTIEELGAGNDKNAPGFVYVAEEDGAPVLAYYRSRGRTEKRHKRADRPLWGRKDALMGLDTVQENQPVVWTGGPEKAMGAWEHGYAAVTELFGESNLKFAETNANKIVKKNPSVVIFAMDNDEAGRQGAEGRAGALIAAGYPAERIFITTWEEVPPNFLTDGFDINDSIKHDPTGALLKSCLAGARGVIPKSAPASSAPIPTPKAHTVYQPTTIRELSDIGNGRRLLDRYGDIVGFSNALGWICFDGRRWKTDAELNVRLLAQIMVQSIMKEALLVPIGPPNPKTGKSAGDEQIKAMQKHYVRSVSSGGVTAAIKEAQPHCQVDEREFDADPWSFNVLNGTIDLRTGKVRPHSQSEKLTKITELRHDPQATCPLWMNVLDSIFASNKPMIEFIQRAVGYSLTGLANEHVLFFAYGTGRNGKSTVIETIKAMMGEYAQAARFQSLEVQKTETVRNDIAHLRGSRMVSVVEANAGARLDEGMIKQLTGGDAVRARFLYQKQEIEFHVTSKFWLAANHKPEIRGTDPGLWSRVLVLPFEIFIPPEQRIKDLPEQLQNELPGILNWAIEGCLSWQRIGLEPPPKVKMATDQYRRDSDILSAFMDECGLSGEGVTVYASEFYKAYESWCRDNGEKAIRQRTFAGKLTERGVERTRANDPMNRRIVYVGIGLNTRGRDYTQQAQRFPEPEKEDLFD